MRRFITSSVAAAVLSGVALASAPAHFSIVKSSPSKDQKLAEAPKRLQVWFSQVPAAAVSQIKLMRETTEIAVGKTTVVAAEKSMYAEPVKPIENGAYTLAWRAAGDDGHVLTGEIKFSVAGKADR